PGSKIQAPPPIQRQQRAAPRARSRSSRPAAVRSLAPPRTDGLERGKEAGPVIAIDAEVLGVGDLRLGAEPNGLVAGVVGQFLTETGNDHVRLLILGVVDDAVTRC